MTQQVLERNTALSSIRNELVVAAYPTHEAADAAVKALQKSGFDMKKLSIVGKDYHTEENVVGYYNTGDRMMAWGKAGAFWGGLWGVLFGSAVFLIPGVGPVLMAGPLVAAIVGGLEGAAMLGGVSVLGAALVGLGIPGNSVVKYESDIAAGKYLLLVHASPTDVAATKVILEVTDHLGLDEHIA